MLPPPPRRPQAVSAYLDDLKAKTSQPLEPAKPPAAGGGAARWPAALQPSGMARMPGQCGGMRGGVGPLPSGVMANLMASAARGCNPMMGQGCNPMMQHAMMQQQVMMQQQAMQQQQQMMMMRRQQQQAQQQLTRTRTRT
jgi:hypothetical protein